MNVGPLVERILELYGDYIYEIIPVNDGSTDSTAEVLSQLARADARVKPLHRTASEWRRVSHCGRACGCHG